MYVISITLYYTRMDDVALRIRLFSTKYLDKWCKEESSCDTREVINSLMFWLAKFSFLVWLPKLPENDFGTLLASYVIDYYYEDEVKQGFGQLLDAIFGQQAQLSVDASKVKALKQDLNEWPHPSNIMRFFPLA